MTEITPLPKKIVESLDKEVKNRLEMASVIGHPGESGRARENIIGEFLRRLIPQTFGIDTGFVIDSLGAISKQIDIVVYRTDHHPVFEIGGIKHFLVESVVAVIENKARITSLAQLNKALDNIRSVKQLDRTNQGRNTVMISGQNGPKVDPSKYTNQIFGAIVTQKSLNSFKLEKTILNFVNSNGRRLWPNVYADVYGSAVYYVKKQTSSDSVSVYDNDFVATDPSNAEHLMISLPNLPNFTPPLATLVQELINFLRVTQIIDFLPTDYLWTQNVGRISPPLKQTIT